MSPLSPRPAARQRQLSNLKQGGNPAPAGNRRALQHGAYAAVAREQLEQREGEIFEALSADLPLREADGSAPAADALVVALLAECLCRIASVRSYLDRRGIEDDKGQLRSAVDVEGRLRREAVDIAESLGLTPRSRVRLGLDLARGVDATLKGFIDGSAEEA